MASNPQSYIFSLILFIFYLRDGVAPPTPTPSPTFTSDEVYAVPFGTDASDSNCGALSPCETLNYALDCIYNNGGIYDNGACNYYNYYGEVNIGNDSYDLSVHFPLSLSSGDLRIVGAGKKSSFIVVSDAINPTTNTKWFECTYNQCYFGLEDLSLQSGRTTDDRIFVVTAGTIYIKNVQFDGLRLTQNKANEAMFSAIGDESKLVFENCTFINMDTMFEFKTGASGEFIDCIFKNNVLTGDYYTYSTSFPTPLIYVNESRTSVSIKNCIFKDNQFDRNVITIENGANIILNNTIFVNNNGDGATDIITVPAAAYTTSKSSVSIEGGQFKNNINFGRIILVNSNGYANIAIGTTIFEGNSMVTDIAFASSSNSGLFMDNCRFLNGTTQYSLQLQGMAGFFASSGGTNSIYNTIWDNYFLWQDVIYLAGSTSAVTHILLNTEFRNIQGRAIYSREGQIATVGIHNCTFYNITTVEPGAAVYTPPTVGQGTTIINRTRFEKCTASQGGAIYLHSPGDKTILQELTFVNNKATSNAADLYISSSYYLASANAVATLFAPGPYYVYGSTAEVVDPSDIVAASTYIGGQSFGDVNFTFIFDSWTFINCSASATAGDEKGIVHIKGNGGTFINNVFKGNSGGSIVRWDSQSFSSPEVPHLDFQGNLFQDNYDIESIFYYEVDEYPAGSFIQFIGNNIFDHNDGAIINKMVWDYTITSWGISALNFNNAIIRNYNHTGKSTPLFSISSSEGSSCTTALGAFTFFQGVVFHSNVDTQLIAAECIASITINNLNISDNKMPTLTIENAPIGSTPYIQLGRYTNRAQTNGWDIDNNQGIILKNSDGISVYNHQVTKHQGIYWLYDNRENNYVNEVGLGVSFSNFNNCDSTNGFSDYGLLTFYGYPQNLHNTTFSIQSGDFNDNVGTLLFIRPTELTLSVSQKLCPLIPSENSWIGDVKFNNNYIETGYLVTMYGISALLRADTVFSGNNCQKSACLGLFDGWYTVGNLPAGIDTGFIVFGHDSTSSSTNEIQLCINSTVAPADIVEDYLTLFNLDTILYNERVTFLPFPCQEETSSSAANLDYLSQFEENITYSKLLYIDPGANLLTNSTCNSTDCEIICNGSVVKYLYHTFCFCLLIAFGGYLELLWIIITL